MSDLPFHCSNHGPYPKHAHHCPECVREAVILIQEVAEDIAPDSVVLSRKLQRAIRLVGYNPDVRRQLQSSPG